MCILERAIHSESNVAVCMNTYEPSTPNALGSIIRIADHLKDTVVHS